MLAQTICKFILQHRYTSIDMSAGPTELLIVADSKANPALICADLYSQAEHGPHSWCALMTDSENLAKQVQLKASSTRKYTHISKYTCVKPAGI